MYETDLTGPVAVLLGNEARGLSSGAAALADDTVRVPTPGGAESLNLAAAATLLLFEAVRQRSGGDVLAQLVAGAAHDIRSPLTAMKGFASTLLARWDRLSDEQRLMMIGGVAQDAARMGVVVSQLVEAARLAAGRLELSTASTPLLDAAQAVAAEVGDWEGMEVEVGGSSVQGMIDPARFRIMLISLIEAAKWWGESGPVHVEVRGDGGGIVQVWRSGSTLDEAEAASVFGPRRPGTGGGSKAGLFVARGLAEAHDAGLEVSASPDVKFTVALPSQSAGSRSHRRGPGG
jgi:signal transduction histidine kinase